MSGDDHPASRPSWLCAADGRPWPCDPAREQLAAEMSGTDLTLWMATLMIAAAREDPSTPPSELYERFIAWTRLPLAG